MKLSLWRAMRSGEQLVTAMRELPACQKAAVVGAVRRRKSTIAVLDVLVATDAPDDVVGPFLGLAAVSEVLIHTAERIQVRLENRLRVELHLTALQDWGGAEHALTGSKLHRRAIRARAKRLGVPLDDPRGTEREVYAALGLPWIPAELRENVGELEAAENGQLPGLLQKSDLRGDLHMHTTASDGSDSVQRMAMSGRKLGYDYIAVTEHSQSTTVANGLDRARLLEHIAHIRDIDARTQGIRILAGIEVDILFDGSLDFDTPLLAGLDWVVASVHSDFGLPAREMTERMIRAMATGVVDCIGHPTGRKITKRDGYALDMDRLLKAARQYNVAMEVNGNPARLDLDGTAARQCREYGVSVVVSSDAHAAWQMAKLDFGVWTARRGWLEPQHVLNTAPWEHIAERRANRIRKHAAL